MSTNLQLFHLIWHYDGTVRGQRFSDWDECEAFSKRLIKAGLVPELTDNSPCPYDGMPASVIELTMGAA